MCLTGDAREALEARIDQGLSVADILITSGGVSMGDLDLIQPILVERGKLFYFTLFATHLLTPYLNRSGSLRTSANETWKTTHLRHINGKWNKEASFWSAG